MAGGTHYYGDVVNELELSTMSYAAGGFIRYRLSNFTAIKAMGVYAVVKGDDKNSSSPWQQNRNWNFQTLILEGSLQFEINLVEDRNSGRKLKNKTIPYLFAGVGAFYFKPQTTLIHPDGSEHLQSVAPLQLSGIKYSQIAAAIPVGVGFRYYVNKKILLGGELGLRYTSTSYIDDIGGADTYVDPETTPFPKATRLIYGSSESDKNPGDLRGKTALSKLNVNDMYLFMGVTLAYNFNKSKISGSGLKRQGCPRFF
ncbi:MAG: hypothetical protein EAY81_10475 [Bacteroidetes bacterium]|nr:MAG: hypothetical protein EAY81_10475 [Bacteroidota bacterium]